MIFTFRFRMCRRAGAALVLCFLASAPALAQRYLVRTYTEADGLPSNNISDILQDRSGRIWLATPQGLASYDGSIWKQHTLSEDLSFRHGSLLTMDESGALWSACTVEPLRIFSYDGEKWHLFQPLPAAPGKPSAVIDLAVLRRQGTTLFLAATRTQGLRFWDGVSWSIQPGVQEGSPANILKLEAAEGRFLLGTSRGLVILKPEGSKLQRMAPPPMPSGSVAGILPAEGGTWIVGDGWLGRLHGHRFHLMADEEDFGFLSDWNWMVTALDGKEGLYFGNPSGLIHFDPKSGFHHLDRRNGLISQGAATLLMDREDNLWVGDSRGLAKLVSRRFTSYDTESGLFADEVTAVLERRAGGFILGHPGGLTLMGQETVPIRLEGNGIEGRVLDLAEEEDGTVWIAANRLGLLRMNRDGSVRNETLGGHASGETTSVLVDHDGHLWASTTEHLYRRESGSFHPVPVREMMHPPSRPEEASGFNRRLFQDEEDTIWLATNRGLLGVLPGAVQRIGCTGAPGCNDIFAMLEDRRHETWIGTRAGLYHLISGAMEPAMRPALDRPVFFIVEDRSRNLWFGTDEGVRRWDGKDLKAFTLHDGLTGSETNRAAGLLDSTGRVWIGTNGGVSVYDAALDVPRSGQPEVSFTSLETGDKRRDFRSQLRVDHHQNDLVFHFRATAFVDEDRVRFRYRLEGFDAAWQGPRRLPLRQLRYTNLPQGRYRLHLQAVDVEDRSSPVAVSPPVIVMGPIWSRTWFRIVIGGLAIAFIWALVSFMQQRRYNRRLKREIRMRTRELQDSQAEVDRARRIEALGLLAGGIAHDFNNLLTGIMGNLSLLTDAPDLPEPLRPPAAGALQASERARSLTRQLLTFSRGGAPLREAADISEVIRESAAFTMSGSNIKWEIDLPEDLWIVEIDPGQISQVINNLLLNARQSMPDGGTLKIRGLNLVTAPPGLPDGRFIRIDFMDTGPGIPRRNLDRIFDPFFTTKEGGSGLGLSTAHSIVQRHQGRLSVQSTPGRGTTFHIHLPATDKPLPVQPKRGRTPHASPAHVLVVDDQEIIQEVVKDMLSLRGYSVVCVSDGDTAVDLYSRAQGSGRPFDAVIMDLTIPGGMGGERIIELLLALDPDVRAVVASGYSRDPVLADHRKHGFRARITKPFDGEQLVRALEQAIGDRRRA
ncbi:MAG: two-component regulator propeller domain-containing protein [Acidobacteriota bacterium]